MTNEHDQDDAAVPDDARDSKDDDAMRALLKRAVEADVSSSGKSSARAPNLLPGVQRKIRQRSRGKFFADGWSTTQSRVNYGLVALVMLLIIAVAYFALGPTGITAR
jgi:hypothetical protein